jgi:Ca-activated chloride channel homolog
MKIKTVGVLAAAGMMLSSLTVWSLTSPRPKPIATDDPTLIAEREPTQGFEGAQFSAGTSLLMDGRLGHAELLAGRDNESFLLVGVRAQQDAAAPASRPLNLSIVIDRSGSMKGRRLSNAISAATGMLRRLRDGDVVSLVSYNTSTEILAQPTTIDSGSRERVIASLDRLTAQGDTCISCGLDAGIELLRQRSGMVDRVLLLSDGEATAGVRDVEGFRQIANSVRRMGAAISSIGVDVDYNERVMAALAQESNGRHHFVENAADLPRIFDAELESLVRTVARGAELEVRLAPGIELEQVLDRTFQRDADRVRVPLGDFAAGEEKTMLMRVRIPRGAAGQRPVADVKLAWDDLGKGGKNDCNGSLSLLLTDDAGRISPLDPLVSGRLNRSQTAAALTEANQLFAGGQVEEARRRISRKLDDLRADKRAAVASAPAGRAPQLEADFARQEAALGSAQGGFAAPPSSEPAPAKPAESRKGKAQVRANQKSAVDLAF